ncbi:MAG: U32 family peptidase [Clostridiales bacterium]|nr:U32 family peptidase [Clostridiales bacterium]
MESMMAAVNAGADAVYMGGSRFGARAYADNPEEDRFLEAIDYAHLHGCRLYMTVNTLVKESELGQLCDFLLPYYERGLDAVIVQDMGVFSLIRRAFPDLPVHASTQMTVTNWRSAAYLKECGATRVVTARELSLEEIAGIRDHVDIEIESFVHGALCYCYSGQCLLSSLIGDRSGNRGRCAQPCRLPYRIKADGPEKRQNQRTGRREEQSLYLMSMKDLCVLDILPDIIEAGVCSLKIEGRMKSPRYTAGVVSVYRKYTDLYLESGRDGYRVDEADRRMLLELFDRGGQTDGYYRQHNGRDMVVRKEKPAFRVTDPELSRRLDREYVDAKRQEAIRGQVTVAEGEPVRLELFATVPGMDPQRKTGAGKKKDAACDREQIDVCVLGDSAQSAQNQPLTADRLQKQMRRTGNSPFYFEELKTDIRGRCFVPVQTLNDLRRKGMEELEEAILRRYRRRATDQAGLRPASCACDGKLPNQSQAAFSACDEGRKPGMRLHVSLEDESALSAVLESSEVDEICLDANGFGPETWADAVARCREAGKRCALVLPNIFRREAEHVLTAHGEALRSVGFDEFLLRSMEEIFFLRELGIGGDQMVLDANLYAMNHLAADWFAALGISRLTLPLEENERELKELLSACRMEREGSAGMEGVNGRTCHRQLLPYAMANETACASPDWEMIVYGHLTTMVSAQCVVQTTRGCTGRPELLFMKDRTGKEIPVKNHCRFCYNTIYNPTPLSLLGMGGTVGRLAPSVLRLSFTLETPEEIREIIRAYAAHFRYGEEVSAPYGDFTRGHIRRGVE